MTTLRDIFTACAPEDLEGYPPRPLAHRKGSSAIHQCRSGHDGHSCYQCPTGGGPPRVTHACGNRHWPQCQQHTTPQWLQHHLANQLPGAPCLLTFTVPAPLRPFIRSQQRPASQAMLHASAMALKRLAKTRGSSGPISQGFPVSSIPGAGHSSTPPTSPTSSLLGASLGTVRPGARPAPTALARSKRSPPSPAPSSEQRCATPVG